MIASALVDLSAAWKGVRAGRWSSLAAIVALALGMGVCLAASAIAYTGLIRQLPLRDAARLVSVRRTLVSTGLESSVRLVEFEGWRARLAGSVSLAGIATETAPLRTEGRDPQEVQAAYVTDAWFDVVGASAEVGRLIGAESSPDVAVISHDFAARLAGQRAASALDASFTLAGQPVRVIGILPPSFSVIDKADVWIAARHVAPLTPTGLDDTRSYRVVGRVESASGLAHAQTDAPRALIDILPDTQRAMWRIRVIPLRESLLGDARPTLLAFLATATLVLLVACANVAMLLVNRAVARSREYSVRLALGADRARLVRTAIFEAALLAVAGALLGAWLADVVTGLLANRTGVDLPTMATLTSATPIVIGAIALTLFVVAVCGIAPLFTVRQVQLATSLRAPASTGTRGSRRLRAAIVIAQLAMTVVLLTGAGLLGRTLLAVSHADIGLDAPDRVATLALPMGQSSLDAAGRLAMTEDVLRTVRQMPGVASAGIGAALPPVTGGMVFTIRVSSTATDATRAFDLVPVTPGYLESLGARLVTGRLFTDADDVGDPVTVLSESALKHLALVTSTVIDRPLNLPMPTARGPRVKPRIIGVIKDVQYTGLDAKARGGVFVLWKQLPLGHAFLIARAPGDPATLLAAMARTVRAADPSLPLAAPLPLDRVVDDALAPRAARFSVVGVFAVGAALLAFVGLSGALIRSVMERKRELAIRAAVGATPERLRASVLGQGALLVLAGIALGLAGAAVMARGVQALFYGVTPHDPLTYVATAVAVAVMALLACYLPARQASRTDPILLLRAE